MQSKKNHNSLFYEFNWKNKINYTFVLGLSFLVSIIGVLVAFFIRSLINFGMDNDISNFFDIGIKFAGVLILYYILCLVKAYFKKEYIKVALTNFKISILQKTFNKNLKQFREQNTGEALSMFSNDIKIIEQDYLSGKIKLFEDFATIILVIAAMIYINYKMFIAVIIVSFLPIIVSFIFSQKLSVAQSKMSIRNGKFIALVKDLFAGITVIKSFHAEKEMHKMFSKSNNKLENERSKYNNLVELVLSLSGLCSLIVLFVMYLFGTWMLMQGEIAIGSLMAFIELLSWILLPLRNLPSLYSKYKASVDLINKLDYIDQNSTEKSSSLLQFESEIKLCEVSFSYETDGIAALSNINLIFKKGLSYAIVGMNGSGKSTLINILLGYYNDYSGNIYIDGVSIREIDLYDIYNMISVIQQDVFIFDATIKENITLYKNYDNELLKKAINMSGLKDIIEYNGMNYTCGENGHRLSGGEKQRISIARSLIKKTPILFMDEAMSNLDNVTAYNIENQILSIDGLTPVSYTHLRRRRCYV